MTKTQLRRVELEDEKKSVGIYNFTLKGRRKEKVKYIIRYLYAIQINLYIDTIIVEKGFIVHDIKS